VNWSLSRIRLYMYAGSLTCARTDGRCVSSGGGGVYTCTGYLNIHSPPLGSPTFFAGSPPTSAGALPPEFIIGSRRTLSLFMAVSQLSICM